MRGLRDKGAFISGGTSGIGLATARRFLDEGARVFVTGLDAGELAAALAELGGECPTVGGLAGDVSDEDDVTMLIEAGAAFIGGCCGSTPDHIRAVRAEVDRRSKP